MSEVERKSERLVDLGSGLELWKVMLTEVKEQDLNANVMDKECFDRLAMTIGRDKRLESLPFMALTDRGIEIISGHHRVRAANASGLAEIHAIVDVTGLSRDQIKAKQLAHNSIRGSDDEQMLARIYQSIQDAEARLEAFVTLDEMELPKSAPLESFSLEMSYKSISLLFMPRQYETFERALEALAKNNDVVLLAEEEQFNPFRALVKRMGTEYDIRNVATVVTKMSEIVLAELGEPVRKKETVPLRDIFGTSSIPVDVADELKELMVQMEKEGSLDRRSRWTVLKELLNSRKAMNVMLENVV